MLVLTPADKDHIAAMRCLGFIEVTNAKHARSDLLAFDRAFQFTVKRIIAQRAEQQRIGVRVSSVGPFHQLGEVKKEGSLHAVFVYFRLCLYLRRAAREYRHGQEKEAEHPPTDPPRRKASDIRLSLQRQRARFGFAAQCLVRTPS